jgi:hypothetical protein
VTLHNRPSSHQALDAASPSSALQLLDTHLDVLLLTDAVKQRSKNRIYVGDAVHKGTSYPGEHHAIIDRALWDRVHDVLRESPRARTMRTRADPGFAERTDFRPDRLRHVMIKAVARAFRWREMLENGTHATIAEIAAAEKINESYVSRVEQVRILWKLRALD